MDAHTFDHWTASFAQRPTRRTALRLLSAAFLGTLLPARLARAQRLDSDEDGLFDDDELRPIAEGGYGTRPDVFDTDGDSVGDGQEIFNRDNGLGGNTDPLVNENAAPPPAACTAAGGACSSNTCCQPDPNYTYVQCCFDANGAGVCTDVAALGTFLCPDPGVPATGCAVGMTNCGGFCTDLSTDHGNCGACGNRCSQIGPDYNCRTGTCTRTCPEGLTDCFGRCVDLQSDFDNCGGCGDPCRTPGEDELISCQNGTCTGLVR